MTEQLKQLGEVTTRTTMQITLSVEAFQKIIAERDKLAELVRSHNDVVVAMAHDAKAVIAERDEYARAADAMKEFK
jgi:hypothetical protein